jgi:AbrB family looped-hinge helix DNA binding protein
METTTLSTKFQLVVPRATRERLGLRPGMKLTVLSKGEVIYLIPQRPPSRMRGLAKGTNPRALRDKKERF